MLLHAGEGHVELLGKVRDRRVCTPELLRNAASGDIRERGERGIEARLGILNHMVQYLNTRIGDTQGEAERGCVAGRLHSQIERDGMWSSWMRGVRDSMTSRGCRLKNSLAEIARIGVAGSGMCGWRRVTGDVDREPQPLVTYM